MPYAHRRLVGTYLKNHLAMNKSNEGKKPKWEYNYLSPDGHPISYHNFPDTIEARRMLKKWVESFHRQGYYSGVERIYSLDELESACKRIKVKAESEDDDQQESLDEDEDPVTLKTYLFIFEDSFSFAEKEKEVILLSHELRSGLKSRKTGQIVAHNFDGQINWHWKIKYIINLF